MLHLLRWKFSSRSVAMRAQSRFQGCQLGFVILHKIELFELYLMLSYIQKKCQTGSKWRLLVIDTFISFVALMIMVFYKALLCEIGCTAVHTFWTEAQFELKGETTQLCLYTLHMASVCLFVFVIYYQANLFLTYTNACYGFIISLW